MSPRHEAARPPDSSAEPRVVAEIEAVYRAHFDFVWRNARRLGCAPHLLDDAVHEVFLVAARRLAEFEGRSSLRTWLFGITYRVVRRMKRDGSRYGARLARFAEVAPTSEDPYARAEASQYLYTLLEKLSEPKRLVFILTELEGMTSAEVATALGWPQGTVDSRLRAARLELSDMIRREQTRAGRRSP